MLRSLPGLGLLLLVTACGAGGGAVNGPVKSPDVSPDQGPPGMHPVGETKPVGLGEAPRALPPPPAKCSELAKQAAPTCTAGDFSEQLAAALVGPPSRESNQRLLCLEHAPEAPPGLIRALRAERDPECADVLVEDLVDAPGISRDLSETLLALGVGARLSRSVRQPPLPQPPFRKAEFQEHFKAVLSPWIIDQAHAIDVLVKVGPRLSGYAKAIVALEAGLADMRFVSVARAINLPDEMKNDPEIRETYLVSLEQSLEPRVVRGRDAALVGLGELQRQGITQDRRLAATRQLLSEVYAGRRIDALDGLLLPPLAPAQLDTPALQIAARLPAFYAVKLAASPNVDDPKLLRARLEQGVPPGVWLSAPGATPSPEGLLLSQRALFRLGQLYFWAEPFAKAAATAVPAQDANAALVAALAKVLARGPRNAAALMLGPTTLPAELRDTADLDALAKQKGPMAGLAEFDAAYLRGLAPPANDPTFWKEQSQRYQRAQKALVDKVAKQKAADLAKAAADTEKELRRQSKP